jgi:hypothetical protein
MDLIGFFSPKMRQIKELEKLCDALKRSDIT